MITINITCTNKDCNNEFSMMVFKLGVFFQCPCPKCGTIIKIKEVKKCQ